MKKLTFGTPEKIVPSLFCEKFNYIETPVKYDTSKIVFKKNNRGCLLELPMNGEEIFGLGLQFKEVNHKSSRLTLSVNSDPPQNTGDSHAPVPFFVTNKGYGIYFDTARYLTAGFGQVKKTKRKNIVADKNISVSTDDLYMQKETTKDGIMTFEIRGAQGIDIYIIEGDSMKDIVSEYNMLSGGGCHVPEWGLGVLYRCYAKYTQDEVINMVEYFKEKEIPCDIIGLEPGWQTASYSCSYKWNDELYPEPEGMIKYLKDNNIHINLWEHAFVHPTSPVYNDLYDYSADYEVWNGIVPDFSIEEAKKIFSDYHKKTFTDKGIDGFKLDECDSSDYTGDWSFPLFAEFPGGMDGEQYHCLFGTLYMKTMLDALGDKETFSEVRNAGALCSCYPFVLYSDIYDHKDMIRGVVNSGFSGILWTPEVRDAKSKKDFIRRLQTNIFSVQCLINAWYCEEAPWIAWDCEEEVKKLLNQRKLLVPELIKAFDKYEKTGLPPVRALVMDFEDDENTYMIDDEYMFCEDLLVAPMTADEDVRKVYIPDGEWVDYWTGQEVKAGFHEVITDNIPVYKLIKSTKER